MRELEERVTAAELLEWMEVWALEEEERQRLEDEARAQAALEKARGHG